MYSQLQPFQSFKAIYSHLQPFPSIYSHFQKFQPLLAIIQYFHHSIIQSSHYSIIPSLYTLPISRAKLDYQSSLISNYDHRHHHQSHNIEMWCPNFVYVICLASDYSKGLGQIHIFGDFHTQKTPHTGDTNSLDR